LHEDTSNAVAVTVEMALTGELLFMVGWAVLW